MSKCYMFILLQNEIQQVNAYVIYVQTTVKQQENTGKMHRVESLFHFS